MNTARETIESATRECESHVSKLEVADEELQARRPLTEEQLNELDRHELAHLDQLIYRFTRLQDSMARRLLPALYRELEADESPKPFLDVLNRLEQIGVISSVDEWQNYRNLRNNLAHDYPGSQVETLTTLNELFDTWAGLAAMFRQARDYYRRHAGGESGHSQSEQ
ncbi:MAG: hypothetical protein ACLFO1_09395 [Spirochaetaceae bacterium]